jgi:hypothetical protein
MILEEGDKILIVYRRLFEGDETRYFAGIVDGYEAGVAKVTGRTWLRDTFSGGVVGKPDPTTKIFSIASGAVIVYELPDAANVDRLRFETGQTGGLWITDGAGFRLDLTERGGRAK